MFVTIPHRVTPLSESGSALRYRDRKRWEVFKIFAVPIPIPIATPTPIAGARAVTK